MRSRIEQKKAVGALNPSRPTQISLPRFDAIAKSLFSDIAPDFIVSICITEQTE
jgi:hypothetical protein